VKGEKVNEEEMLVQERVSCLAAGCLLLIAAGSAVAGACMRWPWLPRVAGQAVLLLAAGAAVWVLAGGLWRARR